MTPANRPLEGLVVLEFAQFLAGPLCGLRLADLGARVIKIERAGSGDLGRSIYLSDTDVAGTNTLFQAINRNKESFAIDLKDGAGRAEVIELLRAADVVLQNFRPGVFERLGFGYELLSALNPRLVYGSVTGYGPDGPWMDLPGQDLLAQARSGLMWLNGGRADPPQPVGLAVADMLAGHNLTQAVLATLVRRGVTGTGAEVETSLLESLIDFQFEVLTTYFNDGGRPPDRAEAFGAHAYLPAPYGVYPTSDGHIAIAMMPVDRLMALIGMDGAARYSDPAMAFSDREAIYTALAARFLQKTTRTWLDRLEPEDVWCAEVMDWPALMASEGFAALSMLQTVDLGAGRTIRTTCAPFRIAGHRGSSSKPAPAVGEHTDLIRAEFGLDAANRDSR